MIFTSAGLYEILILITYTESVGISPFIWNIGFLVPGIFIWHVI